jgi:hypothetical protein
VSFSTCRAFTQLLWLALMALSLALGELAGRKAVVEHHRATRRQVAGLSDGRMGEAVDTPGDAS